MQALGCLLFEMCALRYAFNESNFVSLVNKITNADYGVSLSKVQYDPPIRNSKFQFDPEMGATGLSALLLRLGLH